MDRREYQRNYMRQWRAKRAGAPVAWTIARTETWLRQMARFAQDHSGSPAVEDPEMYDMAFRLMSAALAVQRFGEMLRNSEFRPSDDGKLAETSDNGAEPVKIA